MVEGVFEPPPEEFDGRVGIRPIRDVADASDDPLDLGVVGAVGRGDLDEPVGAVGGEDA